LMWVGGRGGGKKAKALFWPRGNGDWGKLLKALGREVGKKKYKAGKKQKV